MVLKRLNLKPMARVVSAIAGSLTLRIWVLVLCPPRKALKRAGLKMNDIGLIELNEDLLLALACIHDLELDPEIVNVNGGANCDRPSTWLQ